MVHAFVWPLLRVPVGPPPSGPAEGGLRNQAERALAEAVDRARRGAPGLEVTAEMPECAPAAALLAASTDAALAVVGCRGLGGFTGLLVGSVGTQLATHARCPVVVVRPPAAPHGPVLVGVDGSASSLRALDFALREASLAGTGVRVVHVGQDDPPGWRRDTLTRAVAGHRDRFPDVEVTERILTGRAAPVLVEQSAHARLAAVGSRGRGGFTGLLLGSVSQAVLYHAQCPVAVVRALT